MYELNIIERTLYDVFLPQAAWSLQPYRSPAAGGPLVSSTDGWLSSASGAGKAAALMRDVQRLKQVRTPFVYLCIPTSGINWNLATKTPYHFWPKTPYYYCYRAPLHHALASVQHAITPVANSFQLGSNLTAAHKTGGVYVHAPFCNLQPGVILLCLVNPGRSSNGACCSACTSNQIVKISSATCNG